MYYCSSCKTDAFQTKIVFKTYALQDSKRIASASVHQKVLIDAEFRADIVVGSILVLKKVRHLNHTLFNTILFYLNLFSFLLLGKDFFSGSKSLISSNNIQ